MATRAKYVITALVVGIGAIIVAGAYSNMKAAPEEWEIPPWQAGDRIQWERISYDRFTGQVKDRTTSEWELVGPVLRFDGDGQSRLAHRWQRTDDLEQHGYARYSIDLERGISYEADWPFSKDERVMVEYAPGKVFTRGAALQGRSLNAGTEFSLPIGFLNGTIEFTVTSVTADALRVEAIRTDVAGIPYQSLGSPPPRSETRYVYQYNPGAPYPTSITVFDMENDPFASDSAKKWVKVVQRNLLSASFSGTVDQVPTNHGVEARMLWRDVPRAAPAAEDSFLDHALDERLPVQEVLREARADQSLDQYLENHPAARLVDVATATLQGDQEETVLWNLTWGDQVSGSWYSFVRARTIPAQQDVLPDLGTSGPGLRESFGPWRTGGYFLDIPWLEPPSGPQLTLDSALSLYSEHAPEGAAPVFARWGPLVTEANHKPLMGTVHFVSSTPTWAISVGELGYRTSSTSGGVVVERDLDTLWILAESGTIAMTPFAERFPAPEERG